MADSRNYKQDGKSQTLPQYGKKGHKPRVPYSRRECNVDEIRTNDIAYWNKTSGFGDVTKFNWDLIVGRPRDMTQALKLAPSQQLTGKYNPATVMSIDFIPGPGWASSTNDAVNRSLAMVMAKIRASLSTSNIGFETADLGIFFASTASIATQIGFAKRILESYTVWKDRNYAYPRALIQAQGFSYEDISDNINQYGPRLNAAIDRYNNMSLLDCWDIYDRQYSMAHNVFADEDSEFGQLYIFNPIGMYVYDDESTPSKAEFQHQLATHGSYYNNFNDLIDRINNLIDSWYNSSDLYQINGVLLRAFKDAPRQMIPYYKQEDKIVPTVDRAFLMQIMNCTICEELDFDSLDITQDGATQNYVIWRPECSINPANYVMPDTQLLRVFENDVNQDDNMELTRLVNFTTYDMNTDRTEYVNCGTELVYQIRTFTYNTMTNGLVTPEVPLRSNVINVGPTALQWDLYNLSYIQPFRYIPTIHMIAKMDDEEDIRYLGTVGDVYNWMVYTKEDWNTLQFVAYQSLWTPKNL